MLFKPSPARKDGGRCIKALRPMHSAALRPGAATSSCQLSHHGSAHPAHLRPSLSYNKIKTAMANSSDTTGLSDSQHLLAGTLGGLCTLVMTNPIWVVKTRFCLQVGDLPSLVWRRSQH